MPSAPTVRTAKARVAALSRSRPPTDSDYIAAQRDLASANIATHIDHIKAIVAQAPPFTAEQVAQLRVLLEPARAELSADPGRPPTPEPPVVNGGSTAPESDRKAAVAERLAVLDGGA